VVGAYTAKRLEAGRLRALFAWFVLAMAGFMIYKQLPTTALEAVFTTRWPWYIGCGAIGGFVIVFLVVGGRMLGVSTGFQDALGAVATPKLRESWRLPFIAGIVVGGLIAAGLATTFGPTTSMGCSMWSSKPRSPSKPQCSRSVACSSGSEHVSRAAARRDMASLACLFSHLRRSSRRARSWRPVSS
jgi:hypothetical protein